VIVTASPRARQEATAWGTLLCDLLAVTHEPRHAAELERRLGRARRLVDGQLEDCDPSSDAIDVSVDNLVHRVTSPSEIFVEKGDDGMLRSLELMDSDGHKQIIRLDRALALPPA
jgi:hypothetical protein